MGSLSTKARRRASSLAVRATRRWPELERLKLAAAVRMTKDPELKLRSVVLDHRHDDLGPIASRYGIKRETLELMLDKGLDTPGYRFQRDGAFYDYFKARGDLSGASWLDVGADSGCVDAYLADMLEPSKVELCDVNVAPKTAYAVRRIDGTGLDYADGQFDLVFFTYVLHHAADNTIPLLRDAHRVARRHVIVLEDPKETDADHAWSYRHDSAGTFRGLREWRELFDLLSLEVEHEIPLDDDIHSRHLFVLTPRS